MRGRILALIAALGLAGAAHAHRLDAASRFLPRRMVRVETWFDNGDIPKTGQVEVTNDSGELLIKGRLSSQGLFLFDAPEGQGLHVKIDAGMGHGKELAIRPEEVIVAAAAPESTTSAPAPSPHEQPFPIKDVLTGIALIVAVAALVMSLRNARRLRELHR